MDDHDRWGTQRGEDHVAGPRAAVRGELPAARSLYLYDGVRSNHRLRLRPGRRLAGVQLKRPSRLSANRAHPTHDERVAAAKFRALRDAILADLNALDITDDTRLTSSHHGYASAVDINTITEPKRYKWPEPDFDAVIAGNDEPAPDEQPYQHFDLGAFLFVDHRTALIWGLVGVAFGWTSGFLAGFFG